MPRDLFAEKTAPRDLFSENGIDPFNKKPIENIGERALKNLPSDLKSVGQSTIDMVSHPVDTAQGLLNVANGGVQSLPVVGQTLVDANLSGQDNRQAYRDFAQPLKDTVLHPLESLAEKPATTLLNLIGLASGAQGLIKGSFGNKLSEALKNSKTNAEKINTLNAAKIAVLKAGKEAGYVLPPSEVNPSFLNKRLESIAGKAAIGQQAAAENQPITTALTRKELGMAEDAQISVSALNGIRKEAGKSYQDIANLPAQPSLANGYSQAHPISTPAHDLEALKQARNDAQGWYDAAKVSKSPDDLAKAKKFEAISNSLENKIADTANLSGRPELITALKESRKKIAQTYNVEKALNKVTGEVNANDIGRLIDQGRPMTGSLKTIGDFQQAFPKYLREGEKIPSAGVSKSEAITALLMGSGGAATMGPLGAALGAAPLLSTPVRNLLLSKPYQKLIANIPEEKASKILKAGNFAINNKIDRKTLAGILYQNQQENK